MPTADATTRFFEQVGTRGHDPLLRKATGCTRFEIVDGRSTRRWRVRVAKGDLVVEPGGGDADCVVRVDRRVFERVVTGRMNAVAAVLRGDIAVDGDWRLLVSMQRLFTGPPRRRSRA
jgi:hypothetical protein